MDWPKTIAINAWTGAGFNSSAVSSGAQAWTLSMRPPEVKTFLRPMPRADPRDWRDPRVGWGLVLPERLGLSQAQLATADDAPQPVQELVRARNNAPIFRYQPGSANRFTHLRNYASMSDVAISGSKRGIGKGQLPQYLLIYGSPAEIPWSLQYVLNANTAVGRLALSGEALENYVTALLQDWQNAGSKIDEAVAWAVDHRQGPDDITTLMRNAIAAEIFDAWARDSSLKDKAIFHDGSQTEITCLDLIQTLSQRKPALIVTTSHGMTGPLSDPISMKAQLGLPVDVTLKPLDPDELLAAWQPDGAIWYAHACCSAGSDNITLFRGLIDPNSPIDQILQAVAGLGADIAPLPTALLGSKKPLRAFVGHVEPTFNWTLQQPANDQYLTSRIKLALYDNVYAGYPIGWAMHECYTPMGALYTQHDQVREAFNRGENTMPAVLYCQLAARDIQSMVILGDPTVVLPLLP